MLIYVLTNSLDKLNGPSIGTRNKLMHRPAKVNQYFRDRHTAASM